MLWIADKNLARATKLGANCIKFSGQLGLGHPNAFHTKIRGFTPQRALYLLLPTF